MEIHPLLILFTSSTSFDFQHHQNHQSFWMSLASQEISNITNRTHNRKL